MTDLASLQATVYGRVQGVYFRAFVTRLAKEMGLAGYVRNLPDGGVEVRTEGERQKLERLVSQLKVGPPAAKVNEVITVWSEYTGSYSGFSIRY